MHHCDELAESFRLPYLPSSETDWLANSIRVKLKSFSCDHETKRGVNSQKGWCDHTYTCLCHSYIMYTCFLCYSTHLIHAWVCVRKREVCAKEVSQVGRKRSFLEAKLRSLEIS